MRVPVCLFEQPEVYSSSSITNSNEDDRSSAFNVTVKLKIGLIAKSGVINFHSKLKWLQPPTITTRLFGGALNES